MKKEICLCPASINWIKKHLLKSARKTQLANDKRLGRMAKSRARKRRR